MAIVGWHRGAISGQTHAHLLRESAAVRSQRSADSPLDGAADGLTGNDAVRAATTNGHDDRRVLRLRETP
jgi:hypothetical protein